MLASALPAEMPSPQGGIGQNKSNGETGSTSAGKSKVRSAMTVKSDYIRGIFAGLEHGDGAAFFDHVADDVDWTVMGAHPLAGHYAARRTSSPTRSLS